MQSALRSFPSVLVTGPRQSGKTTFLRAELGATHRYVSLDDPITRAGAAADPNGFLDSLGDVPAIIDEIQGVPELFSYLKTRIDAERQRAGRWVLTGSAHFALMRGVTESLAGRIALLDLPPFSHREMESVPRDLPSVILCGGYPEPALHPERLDLWSRSYLQTYVERDVRSLHGLTNLRTFEAFLAVCAARHGQLLNMADVARDVGISQPTVRAWSGLLEASYLATLVPPYFENFGKRVTRAPKLFFLDSALVCALTHLRDGQVALAGPSGGSLFEGWVLSEMVKAFAALGRRPEIAMWRSHDGLEVDFVVPIGGRLLPIEVKLTASPSPKHVEPLRRFSNLVGAQRAMPGLLVCRVASRTVMPFGCEALPWHEFPQVFESLI